MKWRLSSFDIYKAFLEPYRKSVVPKYAKNTYFVLLRLGVVLIPWTPCF